MKAPGERQIIQVAITTYCNLHCSNCTRALDQLPKRHHMTLENVEAAVSSLADWVREPGAPHRVVGCFGGLPTMHPRFVEVCAIWRKYIPQQNAGLWANRLFGHGKVIAETFGTWSNFVAHGDDEAAAEMRRDVPHVLAHGGTKNARPGEQTGRSMHYPILLAIRDYVGKVGGPRDEAEMWEWIEGCDYVRDWSGSIQQTRDGSLRAYFCEIAGSLGTLDPAIEATGLPVEPGWWRRPMADFEAQKRAACVRCGGALRRQGRMDNENTDDVSPGNVELLANPKRAKVHYHLPEGRALRTTKYLEAR